MYLLNSCYAKSQAQTKVLEKKQANEQSLASCLLNL